MLINLKNYFSTARVSSRITVCAFQLFIFFFFSDDEHSLLQFHFSFAKLLCRTTYFPSFSVLNFSSWNVLASVYLCFLHFPLPFLLINSINALLKNYKLFSVNNIFSHCVDLEQYIYKSIHEHIIIWTKTMFNYI